MKKRFIGIVLAAFAALALIGTGVTTAGESSAVTVRDTGSRVFLGFNQAETKRLANSGVAGVLDHPAVRPLRAGSIDPKTKFKRVYVPSKRGYVTYATANGLVREAASHNGYVWISYNRNNKFPLTLWTRWR